MHTVLWRRPLAGKLAELEDFQLSVLIETLKQKQKF